MITKQAKQHSTRGSAFTIQLIECVLVAVLISLSYVFAGKLIYTNAFPFGWIDGFVMYVIMAATAIIILGANKYFSFISRPLSEMVFKVISMVIVMNLIFIVLLYFSRSIRLSLYYFIITDTLQILFLILIKRFTDILKTNIVRNRVTLVVGKNREKNQLLRELSSRTTGKLAFVSYEDERLRDYIDKADNIFLTGILTKKLKDQIISHCILKDKKVHIVPETYEIAMRRAEMTQVGDIPLFAVTSFRLTEAQNIFKRLMDIILSVIGILLTLPIVLFAAIRIRLEDGGPIFYRQIRSGLNGKEFKVIKFRSMVVDAEKSTGAVFAAENDPRITKFGHLMRASRIDEIPQFFNVLMGNMSIVGPRPERPQFVEEFSSKLPEYSGRLAVKPGITGLAQVMGNYTTSAENKAKFDLVYIRDYSLLLDLKILAMTVKVVFTKSQSKGFSTEKASVYDLGSELVNGRNVFNEARQPYRNHKLGKTVLALCCAIVIIFGAMVLRLSALTATFVEAAAQPYAVPATVEIETEIGLVAQDDMTAGGETGSDVQDSSVPALTEPDDDTNTGTADKNDTGPIAPNKAPIGSAGKQDYPTGQGKKEAVTKGDDPKVGVVLTQEQINEAMGKMSMGKKLGIAYDLISRLSAEDIIRLDKLAAGGFTKEEKAAAKEIMYQYFDDTEVEYIKEIYWEYVE
ncbi:MAG: sugar transferase [Eubacteriales bacterium]|nr:sugar transferase [Eubacteriales bacterium]